MPDRECEAGASLRWIRRSSSEVRLLDDTGMEGDSLQDRACHLFPTSSLLLSNTRLASSPPPCAALPSLPWGSTWCPSIFSAPSPCAGEFVEVGHARGSPTILWETFPSISSGCASRATTTAQRNP
eukprot:CAMPEP_0114138524 /NCGR_PEP_ID=MMETSP0043_2-20121206/16369_1 /TAXON_ID=464988 /ORGANISM="Hemiselmis andersenii, Strain CCMP644" /LENGTH=125 /DNA_ID=CAMNT_0001232501 /DNA_START=365 /DNA_END=742 /DNA_ORIENTATION=+